MRSFLLATLALASFARAADFPTPRDTEPVHAGRLTPEQALAQVKLPPGFRATMFAAEPDVQQPIAMALDARKRLWVAECYTYAEAKVNFDTSLRDRILIFEDADNDGRFDTRKVFWDQGQRLSSLELGFGGVWVTCAPQLLFIPDRDGGDVPDGAPEVVLDGWDSDRVRHNIVNGLRWGPDGWLYGRHGIQATSLVGAPGTPPAERTKINAAIWRYHPVGKHFEIVAHGTTNPWGLDWNEVGEAFFTNTVIGHLWHLIPGAHYRRMYGEDLTPHVYEFIEQCADHFHWDTGSEWMKSRASETGRVSDVNDKLGGGHAHCGCLIYQGGQFPAEYRGKVFTLNFHGRRINVDRLERHGSGYIARHEPDFAFFGDPWFRGIDLIAAPDGGIYVADWNDAGECHDQDGIHRTSGRIYKITYGEVKRPAALALVQKDVPALIATVVEGDEWSSRTARRLLHERWSTKGKEQDTYGAYLRYKTAKEIERHNQPAPIFTPGERFRLSTLLMLDDRWQMDSRPASPLSQFTAEDILRLHLAMPLARWETDAGHRSKTAEGAEQRLDFPIGDMFPGLHGPRQFPRTAEGRRLVASYLQRLTPRARVPALQRLLLHVGDNLDPNLPLLIWYAAAPLAEFAAAADTPSLARLSFEGRISLVLRLSARRLAEQIEHAPGGLDELLGLAELYFDEPKARAILAGMSEALRGRRQAPKPAHWDAFAAKAAPGFAADVRPLSALFGDGRALEEVRAVALDAKSDLDSRRTALQSLIDARAPDLREVCEKLLGVRDLCVTAVRGLATFDDPAIGKLLVDKYRSFYGHERPDVISALVSRPAFARRLLENVADDKIPRADLTAFHARQICSFHDEALSKRLSEVWGEVRVSDAAKQQRIAALKTQLTPAMLAKADVSAGRALFQQACAACHRLYGVGGEFGPDLTGSARELGYLLENIIDPSAIVPTDFRLSIVTLKDGRVLSGFVGGKTDRTLTLRSMTDTQTLERANIEKIEESPQSIMPEGALEALGENQIRDLLAYLMSKSQVPLPGETSR